MSHKKENYEQSTPVCVDEASSASRCLHVGFIMSPDDAPTLETKGSSDGFHRIQQGKL